MISVDSTAVAAIGFENGTLAVLFHSSTTIYTFPGVSYALFLEFLHSSSKGTFYNAYIRGRYK